MSNKKQIRLNTIHLDLWFDPPDDPTDLQVICVSRKVSLHSSKPNSRPAHSLSNLIPKQSLHLHKSKSRPFPSSVLSPLKQFQINRHSIQKYLPERPNKSDCVVSHRFPKRECTIKNTNAFKYYLNSISAHRQYTESIAPLEQIHLKLSQITRRNEAKSSFNNKNPAPTQKLNQLLRKNQDSKKRAVSSWTRPSSKKKERCQTGPSIQPWETTEQKCLFQW